MRARGVGLQYCSLKRFAGTDSSALALSIERRQELSSLLLVNSIGSGLQLFRANDRRTARMAHFIVKSIMSQFDQKPAIKQSFEQKAIEFLNMLVLLCAVHTAWAPVSYTHLDVYKRQA